jgi:hypothetical protein
LADAAGTGQALAEQLQQQGEYPILVYAGSAEQQFQAQAAASGIPTFYIQPDRATDYQALLVRLQEPQTGWTPPDLHGVVHLWALDAPPIESSHDLDATLHLTCATTLHLLQALLAHNALQPRLWFVTRDAQAVLPVDAVAGFAQAALWGMARTAALEHPEFDCTCIDLDSSTGLTTAATPLYRAVVAHLTTGATENQRRQSLSPL